VPPLHGLDLGKRRERRPSCRVVAELRAGVAGAVARRLQPGAAEVVEHARDRARELEAVRLGVHGGDAVVLLAEERVDDDAEQADREQHDEHAAQACDGERSAQPPHCLGDRLRPACVETDCD
jgi:hypothetical protein